MYNRRINISEHTNGVDTVYVIKEERDVSPYAYALPFSMVFKNIAHAKLFKTLWDGNKDNDLIAVQQKEIVY